MMTVQNGRPAQSAGRLPREMRVYDFLDALGVAYQRVDHPAAATMEDCAAVDTVLGTVMCKNLVLCNRQQTAFYLLLMPGDKVFKTKDLSAQIGTARLSFASAEKMEALLDVTPGAATVLSLMNDRDCAVQLLIDKDVLAADTFGCHPCVNTTSLRLSTADLVATVLPALQHPYQTVIL